MKEKNHYRDVVADIRSITGKTILGVKDVQAYLKIGYAKALPYMGGEKKITIFQLADKLL